MGETMAPFDNGFGDWNLSWDQWKKGSALGASAAAAQNQTDTADTHVSVPARLRPEAT
jgi:hypothetical protein